MTDNLLYWNQLATPPPSSLKTIKAGRLKGMTDINPQWRLEAMTRVFGPEQARRGGKQGSAQQRRMFQNGGHRCVVRRIQGSGCGF